VVVPLPTDERAVAIARQLIADPSDDRTLVAWGRDIDCSGIEPGALDIWRLAIDDEADETGGSWERVTFFIRYDPYYASNPTVSPDGRTLAFQLSIDGDTVGRGDGILLLDLS
jgi:hypothetical protein